MLSAERGWSEISVLPPPHSQRPLKTGLSYKYKITLKRGNWKPYPSEILHDGFYNSSDSLTKKVKSERVRKLKGMKTSCFKCTSKAQYKATS